jgi:hypothetical protein
VAGVCGDTRFPSSKVIEWSVDITAFLVSRPSPGLLIPIVVAFVTRLAHEWPITATVLPVRVCLALSMPPLPYHLSFGVPHFAGVAAKIPEVLSPPVLPPSVLVRVPSFQMRDMCTSASQAMGEDRDSWPRHGLSQ